MSSSLIQKRKYMKGYNVASKNNYDQKVEIANTNSSLVKKVDFSSIQPLDEIVTADNNPSNELSIQKSNNYSNLFPKDKYEEKCDEIVMRNGDILSVRVEEIGVNEIKYKKCTNLSGPTYTVLKDNVFLIKYANGDKDVFKIEKKEEEITEAYYPKNSEVLAGSEDDDSNKYSGIGIASFVIGLFAYSVFLYLSILVGAAMTVLSIVFGLISMNSNRKGKGFGIAGFILGILSAAAIGIILIAVSKL